MGAKYPGEYEAQSERGINKCAPVDPPLCRVTSFRCPTHPLLMRADPSSISVFVPYHVTTSPQQILRWRSPRGATPQRNART